MSVIGNEYIKINSLMCQKYNNEIKMWMKIRDQADRIIKQKLENKIANFSQFGNSHSKGKQSVKEIAVISKAMVAYTQSDMIAKTIHMSQNLTSNEF